MNKYDYENGDLDQVRSSAAEVATTAEYIARIAAIVTKGADTQNRSLDGSVSTANELSASLKETASQAQSLTVSADELMSTITEVGASIEQITGTRRSRGRHHRKRPRRSKKSRRPFRTWPVEVTRKCPPPPRKLPLP